MLFRRCSWVVTLLLTAQVGAAPVVSGRLEPALAHKVEDDVTGLLHRYDVPGACVMVLRGGRVSYVAAFGYREVDGHSKLRPDTLFEIGSITKQFTAAAILQLEEAGKLRIDLPLSHYLPGAPHANDVTLRQLLTHTSGLHDYLDLSQDDLYRLAAAPISYDDLIARIAPLPLDFAPGSKWSYSNTGYLLLGKVIENVSGETYRHYLQTHIFDPLQMSRTYTTSDEARLANVARGYRHAAGKLVGAPFIDPNWAGAAGFIVAPLGDLAKWDAALRSGKVVSPASYRAMTTSAHIKDGATTGYGFGLFLDSVYGQPRIGHTGGSLGFTTADEYFPDQDLRILAFTNLGSPAPEAGEAITNVVFADLHPDIAASARRAAPGEDRTFTQSVLTAFRELQSGGEYTRFSATLRDKLDAGMGVRFSESLAPYGASTQAIFKGVRRDQSDVWHDYLLEFGPGVTLPFTVRIGSDGKVAGFGVG